LIYIKYLKKPPILWLFILQIDKNVTFLYDFVIFSFILFGVSTKTYNFAAIIK